ncbi:MAG: EAL domain-containing protein [Microcoleaceae cyanobacterium]
MNLTKTVLLGGLTATFLLELFGNYTPNKIIKKTINFTSLFSVNTVNHHSNLLYNQSPLIVSYVSGENVVNSTVTAVLKNEEHKEIFSSPNGFRLIDYGNGKMGEFFMFTFAIFLGLILSKLLKKYHTKFNYPESVTPKILSESAPDKDINISNSCISKNEIDAPEQIMWNLCESMMASIIVVSAENVITFVNQATCQLLGYRKAELIGKSFNFVLHKKKESLSQDAAPGNTLKKREVQQNYEGIYLAKTGKKIRVIVSSSLQQEGDTNFATLYIAQDITEQKQVERVLRQSEKKFRQLAETVTAAAFIYQGSELRYVNAATETITGYTRNELFTINFYDLIHPDFRTLVTQVGVLSNLRENRLSKCEVKIITKQGESRWIELTTDIIKFERKISVLATAFDISDRKKSEEIIRYQAAYDQLTDLPNRTLFNERLSLSLKQAEKTEKSLAVMFLDLDRFKNINDTLGHAAGDRLLEKFAERIIHSVRSTDTVARWGGDEFTVLLPNITHMDDAIKTAQRILDNLKPTFNINEHQLHISSSIGIALYPSDGFDADTLLKNADTALYRAKENGRNNYQLYTSKLTTKVGKYLTLENRLYQALERGEFEIYYQPKVNIKNWEIQGMEALLRWNHPELGLVPPNTFIPIAEENGLILPIGEWTLRSACQQNKIWHNMGWSNLRIAVNLSARQFQQENLVKKIVHSLDETGLEPQFLELEITEATCMQDVELTKQVLTELKKLGISIAMDDFGTGYSSLSYLKNFPLNILKIDKSFVQNLTMAPYEQAIAQAIMALGQGLNLSIVAEGVETKEQLDFLQSLDCQEIQGNYFSPPLPSQKVTRLMQKKRLHVIRSA